MSPSTLLYFFFFFNDTATTEIYTLSLHDALPISRKLPGYAQEEVGDGVKIELAQWNTLGVLVVAHSLNSSTKTESVRSEEHTSELQSHLNLVCRLLLEKKKKKKNREVYIHAQQID